MTDETIVNNLLTATKGEVTIVPEAFGKEALQDRVVEVRLKKCHTCIYTYTFLLP